MLKIKNDCHRSRARDHSKDEIKQRFKSSKCPSLIKISFYLDKLPSGNQCLQSMFVWHSVMQLLSTSECFHYLQHCLPMRGLLSWPDSFSTVEMNKKTHRNSKGDGCWRKTWLLEINIWTKGTYLQFGNSIIDVIFHTFNLVAFIGSSLASSLAVSYLYTTSMSKLKKKSQLLCKEFFFAEVEVTKYIY